VIFGTEEYHGFLRVRTAIEICSNESLYNPKSSAFVMHDLPILSPAYSELVRGTPVNGTYSEMMHLFACSKALNITIQSYCCPDVHTSPHPYTVHISNSSYARSFKYGFVTIMWTPSSDGDPEPNHCIPLVPYHHSTGLPFTHICSQPVAADNRSTPIIENDVDPVDNNTTDQVLKSISNLCVDVINSENV